MFSVRFTRWVRHSSGCSTRIKSSSSSFVTIPLYSAPVDRHLKERMVGAVVLVATAVILIPEMLSGPRSTSQLPAAPTTENRSTVDESTKLKTYSIDLSKPAPAASVPTTTVPTAEPEPPAAPATTTPASTSDRIVATAAPPAEDSLPNTAAPPPKPEPSRPASPSSSLAESPRTTPTAPSGWAVQVGSFGVRATSERIAADLKREGFSAFVVAFHSGNQTMYRVRVGPERNREAAEALLRKLKLRHPTATLVAPT